MTWDRAFLNTKIAMIVAAALICMAPVAMAEPAVMTQLGLVNHTDRIVEVKITAQGSINRGYAWVVGPGNSVQTEPETISLNLTMCVEAHYRNPPQDTVKIAVQIGTKLLPSCNTGTDILAAIEAQGTPFLTVTLEP